MLREGTTPRLAAQVASDGFHGVLREERPAAETIKRRGTETLRLSSGSTPCRTSTSPRPGCGSRNSTPDRFAITTRGDPR
jgi:hypothetical protein